MRAFTLIETLVTIALTTIVMLTLAGLIRYFYQADAAMMGQWQGVAAARLQVGRALADLRSASILTVAESSSLSYETLHDGAMTSASLTISGATFTYYDATGAELFAPVDPAQVRSVLIRDSVGATTILSGAALRNISTTP